MYRGATHADAVSEYIGEAESEQHLGAGAIETPC